MEYSFNHDRSRSGHRDHQRYFGGHLGVAAENINRADRNARLTLQRRCWLASAAVATLGIAAVLLYIGLTLISVVPDVRVPIGSWGSFALALPVLWCAGQLFGRAWRGE